jgi:hypothetical protein
MFRHTFLKGLESLLVVLIANDICWCRVPAEIGDSALKIFEARLACLDVFSAFALEGPLVDYFAV